MCRLEKFHLPLRPNLKDWNMMTLNKKWMRLMVLVGCAALTASCKQAPVAQMEAEYAVLKVSPSDKVLSTTYSVEKPLNFDPFGHAELSLFAKI